MKIYKNPWVTRESYFVKTGAAKSAKMEAAKSNGYSIDFWDGKWVVRKTAYYNKSLSEMPVVCENKYSLQARIDKAIVDTVLGFVKEFERKDTFDKISEAGFDIKENAKWLEEFYVGALKKTES